MNGRVNFGNTPGTTYHMFENATTPYSFQNSINSIQGRTNLSNIFFSKQNVNLLQNNIIQRVSKETGYQIARQNETELQIIMRSIFLQYSKNKPCDIKDQVQELNEKVLNYSVERIIVEISQYLEYKNTVNKLPTPMNHPQNLSNAGSKQLTFFKPL